MLCSCRACAEPPPGEAAAGGGQPPRCGPGQKEDPNRTLVINALLAITKAGRGLWARSPRQLRVCFIDSGIPSLATNGVITLDRVASDSENAARLGHLLLHAAEGPPLPDKIAASRSCDDVVRFALGAEARAHALELTLRRQLEVPPRQGHPFEAAFWAAPPARRVELLRAHFRANPEGGPGLPGYVSAYTQRCEAQKRSAARKP